MNRPFVWACLALLFAATDAFAAKKQKSERPKLVVLDLEAKGVDKATAETVTSLISVALKKLAVIDVLTRTDIMDMASFEEQRQLVGCSSGNCIAELGGALGIAKVVSGSVGKLGNIYVLNLALVDSKTGRVIERETRDAPSQEKLASVVGEAARYLVRSVLEGREGELQVKVSEADAEIEIDGRLSGISPLPKMRLSSGPHKIRVSKKSFVAFLRDVVVEPGQTMQVDVTLLPSPDFIASYNQTASGVRAGAWAATSVGAALAVAAAVTFFAVFVPEVTAYQSDFNRFQERPELRLTDPAELTMDSRHARLSMLQPLSLGLAVAGGAALVAGIVMFAAGPSPSRYARTSVSVSLAPMAGGGFVGARYAF